MLDAKAAPLLGDRRSGALGAVTAVGTAPSLREQQLLTSGEQLLGDVQHECPEPSAGPVTLAPPLRSPTSAHTQGLVRCRPVPDLAESAP